MRCSVEKVFLKMRCSVKKGVLKNEVFCKKGVLKAANLTLTTLLKKRLWHRCFPVKFVKFSRIYFLLNASGGCFWNYLFSTFFSFEILKVALPPSKKCFLFTSMKASWNWWEMLFISFQKLFPFLKNLHFRRLTFWSCRKTAR